MVNTRLLYATAGDPRMGEDAMAGKAVVPMHSTDAELPLVAGSLRTLMAAGWDVVLVAPDGVEGAMTDAADQSRSEGRAIPVVTHMLAAGWC